MINALPRAALLCATLLAGFSTTALAAVLPAPARLVTTPVDDHARAALTRDLPRALRSTRDQGAIDEAMAIPHIRLALRRPPALQAALDTLTRNQYLRGSPQYHQWIGAADLRAYGPAQDDIEAVKTWLTSQGLTVNSVSPSGMSIDFGGSAARVAAAFQTPLHNVLRGTEAHIANIAAPTVPRALAQVIAGVTLHNFFPVPAMARVTPNYTANTPYGTFYAVTPQDFATIYNIKPLRSSSNFYGAPVTGAGVTIGLIEETLIHEGDWNNFLTKFGLGGYKGTLTQMHPNGCKSPGFQGDEGEAALDAEWSSAVAPDAAILMGSCKGTPPFEFGVLTTLTNMVENGTPATIFSISYETDETAGGYGFIQTWTNLLQEGAAQGIAIFVAAGDNGTSADRNEIDSDGLFVNGLADSAYNVSVGGTDFYDTALNEDATYWRAKNQTHGESALSYVPEIPWDNSCASSILWKFVGAKNASQLCNSSFSNDQNGVGGSGSQSVFYSKPDWQSIGVPGVPKDGVRDQPDVSLFAANGIWAHFYLLCMSDPNEGGSPCDYKNVNDLFGNAAGGTSFGSPAFAGIAALIQQTFPAGTKLGNPAPEFYQIAKAQYTTPLGLSRCNSTLGNKISSACVFYDVTKGDIAEPCYAGTPDCNAAKGAAMGIGVLDATVDGKVGPAYSTGKGYSLATGLGTVNVTNLLYNYYITN